MSVPQHLEFFVDPSRCIGCRACVEACTECDTHRGEPMIHLEYIDRGASVQTVPVVCMHCEQPTCAEVCPADAIKRTGKSLRVTFNYRYAPAYTKFRELVMQGVVGRPLAVDFSWMLDTSHGADYFRRWHREKHNSGGLLVHKATHHFDLVNWKAIVDAGGADLADDLGTLQNWALVLCTQ